MSGARDITRHIMAKHGTRPRGTVPWPTDAGDYCRMHPRTARGLLCVALMHRDTSVSRDIVSAMMPTTTRTTYLRCLRFLGPHDSDLRSMVELLLPGVSRVERACHLGMPTLARRLLSEGYEPTSACPSTPPSGPAAILLRAALRQETWTLPPTMARCRAAVMHMWGDVGTVIWSFACTRSAWRPPTTAAPQPGADAL